ncbi:MAG: hypothetical protein JST82_05955 [Bacteroidetes bacterium]|nr:hypothetical protein [Bacteroidota bacterium]
MKFKFMTRKAILVLALLAIVFSSCNRGYIVNTGIERGTLKLNLKYMVDDKAFQLDSLIYRNDGNETYSVTRLQYFISGVKLYKRDIELYTSNKVFYVDARNPLTSIITLDSVAAIAYDRMDFQIGVVDAKNYYGNIDNTPENNAMKWSSNAADGYAFIKLDGKYKDVGQTTPADYMIATGTAGYQSKVKLIHYISVPVRRTASINVVMNINNWFRGQYGYYHFILDGASTYNNPTLMNKIRWNGYDVFYIQD